MFAATLKASGQSQNIVRRETVCGFNCGKVWLALSERAGLIHHERVGPLQDFQRLGVLDEDAIFSTATDADHDRHRRSQPESAWAGNNQYGHGVNQRMGQLRLRAPNAPDSESQNADEDDGRDEVSCDLINHPLDRGTAALGFADHTHDLGEQRVRTDLLGFDEQPACAVDRSGDHLAAWLLLDWNRLTRDHRFVRSAAAFRDDSVGRNLFAWPNAQQIADLDLIERRVFFSPVRFDAPSCLRCQAEQSLDRTAGLTAGLQFQNLPEQNQDRHHHGGVVVRHHRATAGSKSVREQPRSYRRNQAIEIRCADAQCDQRKHVRAAVNDRSPCPLKKRPAAPHDDGRRQGELHPVKHTHVKRMEHSARQHFAHRDDEYRQAERHSNPKAAAHIHQFRVGTFLSGDRARLQGHAALRAVARLVAHDFRMHGTCILDPGFSDRSADGFQGHTTFRARPRMVLTDLGMHWACIDSPAC